MPIQDNQVVSRHRDLLESARRRLVPKSRTSSTTAAAPPIQGKFSANQPQPGIDPPLQILVGTTAHAVIFGRISDGAEQTNSITMAVLGEESLACHERATSRAKRG